jgi:hypothetical protein
MFEVSNRTHLTKSPQHIYIGRGSYWGNPFIMKDKSLEERNRVVEDYRQYLWKKVKSGDSTLIKQTELLLKEELTWDAVYLSCFCHPLGCHGDVIVQYLNWYKATN